MHPVRAMTVNRPTPTTDASFMIDPIDEYCHGAERSIRLAMTPTRHKRPVYDSGQSRSSGMCHFPYPPALRVRAIDGMSAVPLGNLVSDAYCDRNRARS